MCKLTYLDKYEVLLLFRPRLAGLVSPESSVVPYLILAKTNSKILSKTQWKRFSFTVPRKTPTNQQDGVKIRGNAQRR